MNRTRPVLVTGAGGFVGRRMVEFLRASGTEAIAWNRETGDLRDSERVHSRLAAFCPRLILHLAATPARGEGSWNTALDEVLMLQSLALNMGEDCRLIFTGSMAEYGRSGRFDELAPRRPNTAYGFGKFAAADHALALRATHGLDIRIARLFGVYGAGEGPQRLLPHLISRLSQGLAVPLSDGRQLRDFIHVDDVCKALLQIAELAAPDLPIVNVGTGVGISVRAVCETVAELLGADPRLLEFGAVPRRSVDEDILIADTDRLAAIAPLPPQRWLDRALAAEYVFEMRGQLASGS